MRASSGSFTKIAVFVLVGLFVFLSGAGSVVAEEPDEVVARLLREDGVYVASSRRAVYDPDELRAALAEAEKQGLKAGVIVPSDPFPNNEAFALRVRQSG